MIEEHFTLSRACIWSLKIQMFLRIKQFFRQSPFISVSLLATLWLLIRPIVYQITRFWFLDIPFVDYSPVRFEYNIAFTSIIIFLLGEIAALIGLFRKKERFRYWCVLILPLNFLLFNWLAGMIVWALAPPPGIDY